VASVGSAWTRSSRSTGLLVFTVGAVALSFDLSTCRRAAGGSFRVSAARLLGYAPIGELLAPSGLLRSAVSAAALVQLFQSALTVVFMAATPRRGERVRRGGDPTASRVESFLACSTPRKQAPTDPRNRTTQNCPWAWIPTRTWARSGSGSSVSAGNGPTRWPGCTVMSPGRWCRRPNWCWPTSIPTIGPCPGAARSSAGQQGFVFQPPSLPRHRRRAA